MFGLKYYVFLGFISFAEIIYLFSFGKIFSCVYNIISFYSVLHFLLIVEKPLVKNFVLIGDCKNMKDK